MDFRFANLMGAPYRGGNLLLAGTELLSPVGNRVSQVCIDTVPLLISQPVRRLQLVPFMQERPLQLLRVCRSI